MSALLELLPRSKSLSFGAARKMNGLTSDEGCSGDAKSNALPRQMSRASGSEQSDEEEEQQRRQHHDEQQQEEQQQHAESRLAEGYLGPLVPLKEHLERDKDDESLRRWKEQLLGGFHLEALNERVEPEVKLRSLTVMSEGRADVEMPLPFSPNARGHTFSLKEACGYKLKFSFSVHHNIVSGLTYLNTVWKNGIRVEHSRTMLGTFAPQEAEYTHTTEEETTPSGLLARGAYSAKMKFVDDDKRCYLDLDYTFEIRKEWD